MFFINELWNLIKEFAGIYHITTLWPNISKIPKYKLLLYYKEYHNKKSNIKSHIFKDVFTTSNKIQLLELAHLIKKGNTSLVSIGDEVCYNNHAGVVVKVLKRSLVVNDYILSNKKIVHDDKSVKIYYQKEHNFNYIHKINNFIIKGDYKFNPDYKIRNNELDHIINTSYTDKIHL